MPTDDKERYSPVYIGLRPLYQHGQFYTARVNADDTRTASIHLPDGAVEEYRQNLTDDEARDFVELLEGAGLPRAGDDRAL